MAAEIDRIIDRKLIRNRVHYLVSRIDLVADGYSNVIRDYEDSHKKARDGSSTPTSARSRSPSRGRSPGRPKGTKKSAKSPGAESRGRSRSNSVARGRKSTAASGSASNNNGAESSGEAATAPRRGRKPKSKDAAPSSETLSSAAVSQEVTVGAFVSEKQLPTGSDDDTDVLLRSTIQALNTHVVRASPAQAEKPAARKSPREKKASSPAKATKTETQTVSLAYEEDGRVVKKTVVETVETHAHESAAAAAVSTTTIVTETTTLLSSSSAAAATSEPTEDDDASSLLLPLRSTSTRRKDGGGFVDMVTKMTERGWLVSFLSVAVVAGSLLASQLLPRGGDGTNDGAEADLWRAWLPFLTPVVALLLFFHQKDERASGKWVAIALSWRCAAELLVLVGATPREFQSVAAAAAAIANLALLVSAGAIVRNNEHEGSKATLVALVVASSALFLADSWVVVTANPALESRVILMSVAVLGISLSPALTATADDDE
ncbi:hypothetical protein PybrP1_012611 [[Pythium] brassicae (nom. inval.)]|nr:hypothetical protein PybrP1_012611 [[Pythium] brassicae (nom. inval.)]